MPNPKQIMIDIEALGTNPNSPITSIGAVAFDITTGETFDEFYVEIDLESSFYNRVPDADTIKWWLGQSDEARSAITKDENKVNIIKGLQALSQWLLNSQGLTTADMNSPIFKGIEVFANDPDYDLVILSTAFKQYNIPVPWPFWGGRSCRTVCAMLEGIYRRSNWKREGTHHNALDDCKYQVLYISEMWRHTRKKLFEQSV